MHLELRYGYGPLAERCKELIWAVARQVLALGHDVILDWNSWSRARRATWHERTREAGYAALLHYLDVPLDVAIARAASRAAAQTSGAHILDAEGIRHLAAIFEGPGAEEGMAINQICYAGE